MVAQSDLFHVVCLLCQAENISLEERFLRPPSLSVSEVLHDGILVGYTDPLESFLMVPWKPFLVSPFPGQVNVYVNIVQRKRLWKRHHEAP